MKYIDPTASAEVRFAFTAQNSSGATTFVPDGTNPVWIRSNEASPALTAKGTINDLTGTVAGLYEAEIDTSSGVTADILYDVIVLGTIGGNTYTAKVGEFQMTGLADLSQIEFLDQRVWTGTVVSGSSTTVFVCTIVDGDGNSLTTGAIGAKALAQQQQLKNRVCSFNGDQTADLKGQTSQIVSWSDSATDEITVTLATAQALSAAPAVNDTFLISVF